MASNPCVSAIFDSGRLCGIKFRMSSRRWRNLYVVPLEDRTRTLDLELFALVPASAIWPSPISSTFDLFGITSPSSSALRFLEAKLAAFFELIFFSN
eukprot:TRINITY_DN3383_c0_g1_i1.p2 TRINITY_DN3383_c0_g1~~TRINITY_DN3383_c0_g1_i1.p2  ORF type:complete len:97 (-),score=2.84 TRINITY_DN3383_c0_g1_i1:35-325(-)